MSDHYNVLEIHRTATPDEIKKAYRRMALKHHPDKNPDNYVESEMLFKKIAIAYETLSDPQKRASYDRFGEAPQSLARREPEMNMHFFRPHVFSRRSSDLDDAFRLFEKMCSSFGMFNDARAAGPLGRGGSFGFTSSSTSTSTRTVGSRSVTRTTKTVQHADGRVESTITEEIRDLRTGEVTRKTLSS